MHTRALSTCHFFILSHFKGVWSFLRDLSIVSGTCYLNTSKSKASIGFLRPDFKHRREQTIKFMYLKQCASLVIFLSRSHKY